MNVYIKAQESVCLVHPEIKIKDIMSLYCTDKDLEQKIKNQSVYHFIGDHDQRKCFSVLMLVEVIKQVDKTLDVINLGAEDFIVYYKRKQEESKIFHYGKIVFVILVAFFGASFSIMDSDTIVTGRSVGAPVRVLKNRMSREYVRQEKAGADKMELEKYTLGSLRRAVFEGDTTTGSQPSSWR